MSRISITKPYLPVFADYVKSLKHIWETGNLTNGGDLHAELEQRLSKLFLGGQVSLVCNGTIALQLALLANHVSGKVITTPYSFVATANSIILAGSEPVFIDTESDSFNIDPELICEACDKHVSAIMPVHVYGIPCDNDLITQHAKINNLKVIYDAAHAFNVRQGGNSVLTWGDTSVLSFHATKVFHTFEGGAIVCSDENLKRQIDQLKNFGFDSGGDVTKCGANGKMNEAQAAMGLVLLDQFEHITAKRKKLHGLYYQLLCKTEGIRLPDVSSDVDYNYAYFPIIVNPDYSLSRDELYQQLIDNGIYTRKYFYPLITDFSYYQKYSIVSRHKIPNARRLADAVLCLPLYPDLAEEDVCRICEIISSAN